MTGIHLGGLTMSALSGLIVAAVGYTQFFFVLALFAILMVLVSIGLFRGEWILADAPGPG
jgi:hypothetical protein